MEHPFAEQSTHGPTKLVLEHEASLEGFVKSVRDAAGGASTIPQHLGSHNTARGGKANVDGVGGRVHASTSGATEGACTTAADGGGSRNNREPPETLEAKSCTENSAESVEGLEPRGKHSGPIGGEAGGGGGEGEGRRARVEMMRGVGDGRFCAVGDEGGRGSAASSPGKVETASGGGSLAAALRHRADDGGGGGRRARRAWSPNPSPTTPTTPSLESAAAENKEVSFNAVDAERGDGLPPATNKRRTASTNGPTPELAPGSGSTVAFRADGSKRKPAGATAGATGAIRSSVTRIAIGGKNRPKGETAGGSGENGGDGDGVAGDDRTGGVLREAESQGTKGRGDLASLHGDGDKAVTGRAREVEVEAGAGTRDEDNGSGDVGAGVNGKGAGDGGHVGAGLEEGDGHEKNRAA